MKLCIKCGNQVDDDALFCDWCGNRFEAVQMVAEAVTETVAEAVVEPVNEVAEIIAEPVAEVVEPVAEVEAAAESVAEAVAEPVNEVAEIIAEPVAEVVEPVAEVEAAAESVAEAVEPVAEAVEPVVETVAESVTEVEAAAEFVAEAVEPVAEAEAEPVNEVAEIIEEAVAELVTEAVEPVAEAVAESVTEVEATAESVAEAVEPVAEAEAEPVTEAVEPVAETVAESVTEVEATAESVAEAVTEPVNEVAEIIEEPVAEELGYGQEQIIGAASAVSEYVMPQYDPNQTAQYDSNPAVQQYQYDAAQTAQYDQNPAVQQYQYDAAQTAQYDPNAAVQQYQYDAAQTAQYDPNPAVQQYQYDAAQTAQYAPNPAVQQYQYDAAQTAQYDQNPAVQQYQYDAAQTAQYGPNAAVQQYQYDAAQTAQYDPNAAVQQYQYDAAQTAQYDPNQQTGQTPLQPVIVPPVKKEKKPFPVKWLIIGISGLAAVAVIIILIVLLTGGSGSAYGLYIKDGEIQYTNLSQKEAFQVTKKISSSYSNRALANENYYFAEAIRISSDGKYIFYVDGYSLDYLYYREINNTKAEPVKIDSISNRYYVLSDDDKTVTYKKNDDLYQYRLGGEKTKVASNVVSYVVSEDAGNILWLNTDMKLSIRRGSNEAEKIDSDVDYFSYVNDDLSVIYYVKNNILYKKSGNAEKEKIASNIGYIYDITEKYAYYTKQNENYTYEADISEIIDDDMAEYDAKFRQNPVEYPSWSDEDYDAKVAEYEKYWAEDREVSSREYMRSIAASLYSGYSDTELYYYNGKESTKVSEQLNLRSTCLYSTGNDIMLISERNTSDRVKMSELFRKYYSAEDHYFNDSEYRNRIESVINNNIKRVYISGGECKEIDFGEAVGSISLSADGKTVYYVSDVDSKDMGILKQADISKGVLSNEKVLCDDISSTMENVYINDMGIVYFTDVNDKREGTMYLNDKEIASDVYVYSYCQDGRLYFKSDVSSNTGFYTLAYYDGKVNTIAEDVYDYYVLSDNSVLYLNDYSIKSYNGELYRYKNGKATKLDTDVIAIIHK